MRRRISREDFEGLAHLAPGLADGGVWEVCDDYELRGDQVVAKFSYHNSERWKPYMPLTDAPDLFLRFARLCEEPNFEEATLAFTRKSGLPDSEKTGVDGKRTMPERLSLSEILAESRRARTILSLYESALNMDVQAARAIFSESRHDPTFKRYYDILSVEYAPWDSDPDVLPRELWFALDCAGRVAQKISDKYCSQFCFPAPHSVAEPKNWGLSTAWQFDNLVGAMYLQAYWMMTSGDELTRCEYCGRIISLSRPHPEGRKSRRDKRFCDDACRQANHRSKKKA